MTNSEWLQYKTQLAAETKVMTENAIAFATKREQERKEAAVKFLATAGNSMTANCGPLNYTASRPVAEYINGKPVFGLWTIHSECIINDAEGDETFTTASEFVNRMAAIPFGGMSSWK